MNDKTKRIEELIRAYGADLDRWPASEGLGRPRLSGTLEEIRAEEQELDTLIRRAPVPAPSEALRARILSIPGSSTAAAPLRGSRSFSWLLHGFWRPAGVAVCALVLGVFMGQVTLPKTTQSASTIVDSETETLFADLVLGPADNLSEFPQ